MPTFPTMSSGSMKVQAPLTDDAIAMYPSTIISRWGTRVVRFVGDQEQRWTVVRELREFVLEYRDVNGYDMSVLRNFFRESKGMYVNPSLSNVFDITLMGQNYQYCAFDQDALIPEVGRGETYSFVLKIRQLRRNG